MLRILALTLILMASSVRADDGFRRGVNLSHWYAQSFEGYGEGHLSTYFTAVDAKLIADAGFDHVRLTLDPTPIFGEGPRAFGTAEADPEAVGRLKERIGFLLDAGLNVIVDLHPDSDFKASLNEPAGPGRFAAGWLALAMALDDLDHDRVWFELLNEPHNVEEWRGTQLGAVEAIRLADPRRVIVVNAGNWSHAASLYGEPDDQNHEPTDAFEPYAGFEDLVYTFHYYDPHVWTHQAAGWGWAVAKRVEGLPWPVDPDDAGAVADRVTSDDEAHRHIQHQAAHGFFTKAWAREHFDKVAAWQERHGVPVYVGEFGVYAKAAPRESRLRWHAFVTDAFEERGWGWAVWDYSGGFAMFPGDPGQREADVEMLEALGLTRSR